MGSKRKRSMGQGCYSLTSTSHHQSKTPTRKVCLASNVKEYHDLDVPMIFDFSRMKSSKNAVTKGLSTESHRPNNQQQHYLYQLHNHAILLQRLAQIGYSVVALSHLVHGCATEKDHSDNAIPIGSIMNQNPSNVGKIRGMTILRRLNVIVEQVSDLACYTDAASDHMKAILNSYDIIAISPRNEAVFAAACSSSNLINVDLITLDYTGGRGSVQLPYKLRTSDISSATQNGISFEIPYSASIIDPTKRKAFVNTARSIGNISSLVGSVPLQETDPESKSNSHVRIIISSGTRINANSNSSKDFSVMALRSSSDIMNIGNVLLGWCDKLVNQSLTDFPSKVVSRGHSRRRFKTRWSSSFNGSKGGVSSQNVLILPDCGGDSSLDQNDGATGEGDDRSTDGFIRLS